MRGRSFLRLGGAVLAVAILCGCRAPVRNYQCVVGAAETDVDVVALWRCNRDVMLRAARGKKFSIREFEAAARFFEELTGIAADRRTTELGPLPGSDLRTSIDRWDAWYRDNEDRLVWDREARHVVAEE